MKLDELDKLIITHLYKCYQQEKETTTWEIAKKKMKSVDYHLVTEMCNKVKRRLESYAKKGFVIKDTNTNGKIHYILNLDIIQIKKHKFDDGFKKSIVIRIEN